MIRGSMQTSYTASWQTHIYNYMYSMYVQPAIRFGGYRRAGTHQDHVLLQMLRIASNKTSLVIVELMEEALFNDPLRYVHTPLRGSACM